MDVPKMGERDSRWVLTRNVCSIRQYFAKTEEKPKGQKLEHFGSAVVHPRKVSRFPA